MNELQEYTASIPDSNPNKAELIRQWKIDNNWGEKKPEPVGTGTVLKAEEVKVKLPSEKLIEDIKVVEPVKTEGDAAGAGVEPVEIAAPVGTGFGGGIGSSELAKPKQGDIGYALSWSNKIYTAEEIEKNLLGTKNWKEGLVKLNKKGEKDVFGIPSTMDQYMNYINNHTNNEITTRPLTVEEQYESISSERPSAFVEEIDEIEIKGVNSYDANVNNKLGDSIFEPGSKEANNALLNLKPTGETLYNQIQKGNYNEVTTSLIGTENPLIDVNSYSRGQIDLDQNNLWTNRGFVGRNLTAGFGNYQGVPLNDLQNNENVIAYDVKERPRTQIEIKNEIERLEIEVLNANDNVAISELNSSISILKKELADEFGNLNTVNVPHAINYRVRIEGKKAKEEALEKEKLKQKSATSKSDIKDPRRAILNRVLEQGLNHIGTVEQEVAGLERELETSVISSERRDEIEKRIKEIEEERNFFGGGRLKNDFGGKLYDKNTGKMVDFNKAPVKVIETQQKAEDLAETTELNILEDNLLNRNFELVALAKSFLNLHNKNKGNVDLGETPADKLLKPGREEKDLALINYLIKNGQLPEDIYNLSGDSLVAKTFNDALDNYEVINKAILINRNPLTAKQKNYVDEAIDGVVNIIGKDITTKQESQMLFIDVLRKDGTFDEKELKAFEVALEANAGQKVMKGVPTLFAFGVEIALTRKLSGNKIAKVFKYLDDIAIKYFKGNKYMKTAINAISKGLTEGSEFAAATALKNVVFNEDESVGESFAQGGAMGFGGTFGKAFFGALNKTMLKSSSYGKMNYYLDKSKVYKNFIASAQSAAGGATAYISGGVLMGNQNLHYEELTTTFVEEWSKMFILGKLQKGLRDPGGSMRASYRRMSNDILGFSNLSYNSKKGATALNVDTKIISNPTETSNEQVAAAAQAKIDSIAKDLKDGKITTEESLILIKQAAQAKMALLNQIGINQAKAEIQRERKSGQAPTVAEEYTTLSKIKGGEKLNVKDSKTLAELPPELILEKLGVESSTENLRQANDMINRESTIQNLLNGGNGKFVVTNAGFQGEVIVKEGQYRVSNDNPKLREETYEFLNKKFALNDSLTKLKNMNTSGMSVLEKENYDAAVKSQEAELSNYQEGGVTENILQGKLQKEALKIYEANVAKSKELAKTNVKGEVVESLTKPEFQKAYDASGLKAKDVKDTVAFIDPNTGNRFINREKALEIKSFNVATHEDTHAVALDVFKDSKGNVTEEGIVVIDNVLSSLSPRQQKILKEEVDSRYETEKDKSEWYEENIAVLSELIKDKVITFNKGIGEKLLDMVPLYKKYGFENLEINAETGEGIFEMLRGLAEGSKDAQEAASKFAEKAARNKTIETKSEKATFSKTKAQDLAVKSKSKEGLTKKEEDELVEQVQLMAIEALGYKQGRGTVSRDKALGFVNDYIPGILRRFKPVKNIDGKDVVQQLSTFVYRNIQPKQAKFYEQEIGSKSVETRISDERQKELESIEDTSRAVTKEVDTDVKLVDNIKIEGKPLSVEFKDKVRGFVTEQLENVDVNSEKFRKQVFKPSKAFVDLIVKDVIGNPKQFREFLNSNPTFYKGLSITDLVAIDDGRVKKGQPRLFTELNRRLTKQSEIEKFMMQGRVPYLTTTQQKAGAVLYNRLNPKVAAVINNFFGSTPQNNSNRKRAIAKAIANKFIAEATPSTEAFQAKPQLDKAKIAERLQVSQEAKFSEAKKAPKVMDSKNALIISEGYVPVERGKKGVDRTRKFVLGVGSDVFGVELMRALIATNKVLSTAGNRAYSYKPDGTPKPGSGAVGGGYNFISNVAKLLLDYGPGSKNPNPKTIKDTLALIEAGELGDLAVLQKELTATKKEGIYSAKDIAAIKRFIAHKNTKGGGIENNTRDIAEINRGKKLMLDGFRKMYEADKSAFPLIAEVSYSFNSNKNPFRDLATLVGEETGLKKGEKTWEEHMMQFGMYTNEMLKAIKGSDKAWSSFVDWSNNNYYQLKLSKEASNLIDKNFKGAVDPLGNILVDWNAKSQFHPLQIESFKRAVKEGDYSKVIDPMIRAYNEYVSLNPFSIKRLGVTDAKRYLNNVEISKTDQKNLNVQAEAAKLINQVIRSEAGFLKEGDPNYVTRKQAGERLLASENLAEGQEKAAKLANEIMPKEIQYSEPIPVEKGITALAKTDKALANGRKLNAPVKKIRALDFDDTVGVTKSNVLYTMPDGKTGKIDAATFAKEAGNMEKLGAEWDFSEFSKVVEGKKGPLFEVMKTIFDKRGGEDLFILTARPSDAAGPIKEFLESLGVNIPIENITGLGNGSPEAKAGWIMGKAAEGYNDFYFADDHIGNVKAVKEVLSQLDVKSKVQQAKFSKAKTFDTIVNDMIKDSAGIETYKEYSAARAKTLGANKGRFNFLIPASAEDFTGLLYKMLGKGKKVMLKWHFLKQTCLILTIELSQL